MRDPTVLSGCDNNNNSASPTTTTGKSVAGGNSDSAVANPLDGDEMTGMRMNIGIMSGSITGSIRFCASLTSLQAAPTAIATEP